MTTPIDRGQAVHRIAAHLADRDSYVITVPPDLVDTVAENLASIPERTLYLDGGLPAVLRTDQASVLAVTGALTATAAVLVVPKTVPAAALTKALGQHVPEDGSQDIVVLMADGPIVWPLLFVDALEVVDPRAAGQLRASNLPNLN